MNTYLFSYPYNGGRFSLEIPADTKKEAVERFKMMPWGRYEGELIAKVPAETPDWFPELICRIANWIKS